MSHTVFIALGANLGDRQDFLRQARLALAEKVSNLACSPVYQTPPWGYLDQPDFLNQVVKAETDLTPQALLDFVKSIENRMGRVKEIHNGPRLIDLDILFYDDIQLEAGRLIIPHPRMAGRGFVLAPLADLAPDLVHPASGKTMAEMLRECDTSGIFVFAPAEEECL
jgi:2-amino-4-hydroxy-6-hydroxymethyldihydropteridine diphosphokinase